MKKTVLKKVICIVVLMLMGVSILGNAESAGILILPEDLEVIETEAFYGATSLEKVIVPYGTTEILSRAFAESSLKEIELPETICYIADDAFDGCVGLEFITVEGSYADDWANESGFRDDELEDDMLPWA